MRIEISVSVLLHCGLTWLTNITLPHPLQKHPYAILCLKGGEGGGGGHTVSNRGYSHFCNLNIVVGLHKNRLPKGGGGGGVTGTPGNSRESRNHTVLR